MKIISSRQEYECDHSTRDYGYISGMKVYYDYGFFEMEFAVPYNTELLKLLQKYKNIYTEKKFNKILVTLRLYCDDFNEDENKYVKLASEIKNAIIKEDLEVIKIINSYHVEDEEFKKIETKTALGKKLQKVLTV